MLSVCPIPVVPRPRHSTVRRFRSSLEILTRLDSTRDLSQPAARSARHCRQLYAPFGGTLRNEFARQRVDLET